MFQRGVSLVRRKDLNVAPGETDKVRLELGGGITNRTAPLGIGKEGEIEDALPHIRLAAVNKISEISHPDGIDLFAGEKDVED
jgi:hypothetical protein